MPKQDADNNSQGGALPTGVRRLWDAAGDHVPGPGMGQVYSYAIALNAFMLGVVSAWAPAASLAGATAAGALFVLRERRLALAAAAAMLAMLFIWPLTGNLVAYWTLFVLLMLAGVLPTRLAAGFLRVSRWTWALFMVVGTGSLCLVLLRSDDIGTLAIYSGSLCSAYIGAGLARHLAMVDARILAWGEDGLSAVTRDLLLGRITSGMLHDLSQPLNVIAMANGNLDYIVEHLDIADDSKQQLRDRISRIGFHTEGAAFILSLFRWFGRDGNPVEDKLDVRSALERAVAATKSNVRHHGITVNLRGNALDYLLPQNHGVLEMMAVAALLSAFSSYKLPSGEKRTGTVLLHASTSPAHILIMVQCTDEEGRPIRGKGLDNATLWLVEQIAREADGDFRCMTRKSQPAQFIMRLARDDI